MIGWELPPHNSGGLGTACAAMAQAIVADGLDLTFTLPYSQDDINLPLRIVSCDHLDFLTPPATRSHLPPFDPYQPANQYALADSSVALFSPTSWLEQQVQDYADYVLSYARTHADEFDIIHAHDWMSLPAAIKIKHELGKPFLAHIHSTEYDRTLANHLDNYISRCELAGMRLADRVIAVSYYTKRLLVEKYGIDPEKIDVVHNGVAQLLQDLGDTPREFAYKRPVVVFMGRLTIQKGPDYFLDLAEKLISRRPDILFIVSGMGDMYQQLLLTNAHKSLSANVLFSGFVRGGAQQAILKRADVFVMPSVSEPFGLVATEAAMLHTPVIASKNSGVVEIISGSPQFDFWDTQAMADEVLHLLDDADYRERVIADQLAHLQQHTWTKTARKIEKIYKKVAKKKTPASKKTKTKTTRTSRSKRS